MKNNKQLLATNAILLSTLLTGCGGLYSNYSAPVYSGTQAKRHNGYPPAVLNSTLTPAPSAGVTRRAPMARPSNQQLAGRVVTGTYPEARPQPQRPVVKITPKPVAKPSAVATTATAASVATANSKRLTAASKDSRIKEASELLAKVNNSKPSVAANRPSAVSDKTSAMTKKATETAAKTADTTSTAATQSVPKAVAKAVETAAPKKPATTVKPKPVKSTPKRPATATTTLLQKAHKAVANGKLEQAASALERAHRIEPRNSKILYDIAQIRYAQGKYAQAESFASKAANTSSSSTLSKKIWTLLGKARKANGNASGAASALKKAAQY
ncbi:MAG: hypothetical protein CR974_00830 [Gammaproteobacteria bacterium]|nr:MAG: hypothetical protein CR974_00830 [Gammaproteobacteria bacterium]